MNDDNADDADKRAFERYVHEMSAAELRAALHDMTVVVAHLVILAGGEARIARFGEPQVNGGWVAVRHHSDGSMTLRYCASRAEVDAVSGDAIARNGDGRQ